MNESLDIKSAVKVVLVVVLAAVAALAIEIVVFNWQAVETAFLKEVQPVSEEVCDSDGYHCIEYTFDDADLQSITLTSDLPEDLESYSSCSVFVIDEGNSAYSKLGDMQLGADDSYAIHPTGKVKKLLIAAAPIASSVGVESESETTGYNDVGPQWAYSASTDSTLQPGEFYVDYSAQFNVPVPVTIIKKRLLLLFACLLLLYAIRPKSVLYRRSYSAKPFLACLCLVCVACVGAIVATHYANIDPDHVGYRQYIELAEAFANGQLFLDAEPSAALMAMDNPYDTGARAAAGVDFLWDYAYFNGHYYVYFGVLPVLLYQLPFYLLTGNELPVVVDVAISAAVFCCGAVFLLKKTCDRWYSNTSQGFFLILLLVLLLGSWAVFACAVPGHYGVPIITGLACLVWGLGFWVGATEGDAIRSGWAVAGSAFVALVIACRPQLLAGGVLGLVLLAGCFKHMDKRVFARRLALALVPFVVIFALVGWYNAARFGSPLDFGANYNLTTNDMTHRAFSLDILPFALFTYLIQPPSMVLQYPYMTTTDLAVDYYGLNIVEIMWGGIFALTPVLFVSALLLVKRFRLRFARTPLALAVASIAVGFVLVVFDASGAGVLMRYVMDFGFFFAFAAVLCIAQLWRVEGFEALLVNDRGALRYSSVGLLLVAIVVVSFLLQGIWLQVNAEW